MGGPGAVMDVNCPITALLESWGIFSYTELIRNSYDKSSGKQETRVDDE